MGWRKMKGQTGTLRLRPLPLEGMYPRDLGVATAHLPASENHIVLLSLRPLQLVSGHRKT